MMRSYIGSLKLAALGLSLALVSPAASAQTYYQGQIIKTAAVYCPAGTFEADGRLLSIFDYTALFSLYGTAFGGNGFSTFGLPDLRGRTPMGMGQGVGLTNRVLGQQGGLFFRVLTEAQMPAHTHQVRASANDGTDQDPGSSLLASPQVGGFGTEDETIYSDQPPTVEMADEMIRHSGLGEEFTTNDPALVIRYCIVANGIFPSHPP